MFVSGNEVNEAFLLGTRIKLTKSVIYLQEPLAGIGGATFVFETPEKELAIAEFCWNVRPGETPTLHKLSLLKPNGTFQDTNANLKYEYFPDVNRDDNKGKVVFSGSFNNTYVYVKKQFPFWTNVKEPSLQKLIARYNVKIQHE